MLDGAFQVAGFAYQGSGAFAYQETAPEVVSSGTTAGAGYPVDWQGKRRKLRLEEQPEKHLKAILDEVVAEYYADLTEGKTPKATKKAAAKIVRPFVEPKSKQAPTPPVEAVDWAALERNAKAVEQLVRLWNAEVDRYENDEDDDDAILMMLS